ncbi:MAG: HAD family phosphatase [Candidatus Binatia bacterium]|nr:HAD family phosphatase [Candidatus Binatia bacterium]
MPTIERPGPGNNGLRGGAWSAILGWMSQHFDAVLFDFGGVFTASPFQAVGGMAKELGTSPDRLIDVVFGSYSSDTDHPWHRLERGELAIEEAREAILGIGSEHGFEADLYKLFAALAESGGIREALVDCARGLRRNGFRTGLLTNNVAEFREHWRGTIPVDELFHDVVDSSEVGMRKPDLRIFALACERLSVEPARSIFLDDHPGNIDAARKSGLVAVLVEEDPTGALAELDRLLGR